MDPILCGTSLVESQGGDRVLGRRESLTPARQAPVSTSIYPGLHQHANMSPAGHSQPCQSWEPLSELEQEEGFAKLTGTRYIKLQL